MKKNMGAIDRSLRLIIAAIIATLYFTNVITGTVGIILFVLGGVFLVTSFVGFCPLYSLFEASTRAEKKALEIFPGYVLTQLNWKHCQGYVRIFFQGAIRLFLI